ncbi:MAG: hypothetical protein ABR58_07050 [Acidimicrobium sp. BACL19 MAG-120924-bin39]|nr:MAG: hypothetical protein ABR58_07050 [Acidimicrobium sp. BACL19 MAG-120924-bin39]
MGEWETGLNVAHDRGVIDAEMRDRLAAMEFDRESPPDSFPMRIALIVLGAILLVSAGFAIFIRLVPDDPSQLLVSAMLLGVAAVAEAIAWIVRRTNAVAFLAGIIGSFAGIPLGVAVAVALPGDPNSGAGALGALIAAVWSVLWFTRTKSGWPVASAVLKTAVFIMFFGEWVNMTTETAGVVLCVFGVITAVASIFGRINPNLPPLVASLIVVGGGCIAQNTYGGKVIAAIGIAISAGLFLLAYRRSDALMSAATAVSTGVWAVVLTGALTDGAIVPIIAAAGVGAGLVFWGIRLSRR